MQVNCLLSKAECFSWPGDTWGISRIWRDVQFGRITMSRGFIENYARMVLALTKESGRERHRMPLVRLDLWHAMLLPEEAMQMPVLLLDLGRDTGLIRFSSHNGPRHILADGNHRIARAFLSETMSIDALLMGAGLSQGYPIDSPILRKARRAGALPWLDSGGANNAHDDQFLSPRHGSAVR